MSCPPHYVLVPQENRSENESHKHNFLPLSYIQGPIEPPTDEFTDPYVLKHLSKTVLAQFDKSGVGFPIRALLVGPRALSTLKSRNSEVDYMVTEILASRIREFLANSDNQITISDGEVLVDSRSPGMDILTGCEVNVHAFPGRTIATVHRTSKLRAGGTLAQGQHHNQGYGYHHHYPKGGEDHVKASFILSGDLDLTLNLKSDAVVTLGKNIFGKCFTKFKNRVPMQMLSQGQVWVGARIFAKEVRIEDRIVPTSEAYINPQQGHGHGHHHPKPSYHGFQARKGYEQDLPGYKMKQKFLIFKYDLKLQGKINKWNVDAIEMKGCEVRFLGFKVISFCGLAKRTLKREIEKFIAGFSEAHLPKVLHEIEQILRSRMGDEIAVPIILANEKTEVLGTLLRKAETVAQLKGDLIKDLSVVAGTLGSVVGPAASALPGALDAVSNVVSAVPSAIESATGVFKITPTVINQLGAIAGGVGELAEGVPQILETVGGTVGGVLGSAAQGLSDLGELGKQLNLGEALAAIEAQKSGG